MAEVREINPEVPPSGTGCARCLAADPPAGGSISGGAPSVVTSDAATPHRASTHGPTSTRQTIATCRVSSPGGLVLGLRDRRVRRRSAARPALATPKTSRHPAQPAPCPRTGSSGSTDSALLPSTGTGWKRWLLRLGGGRLTGQDTVELAT